MTAQPAIRVLRVFYRDRRNAVAIPSSRPEPLMVSRIAPLAERLLDDPDNFLGVVDRNDVILQAYAADAPDRLTLELVYPDASACLRLDLARDVGLRLLGDLPECFDAALLPGAERVD